MEILNFPLLKQPLNWIIILLMVIIAGIALHLILDFYEITPATKKQ